jgi:hypothetical protein
MRSRLNTRSVLVSAVLAYGCLRTVSCLAEDHYTLDLMDAPAPLYAVIKTEETLADKPLNRAYLQSGTNRFAFIVPAGYRLDASKPDKVVLSNEDYSCMIVLRLFQGQYPVQKLDFNTCREWVISHYRNARVMEEFSQGAGGSRGPAFDLQWTNSAGVAQFTRIAYVPSAAGVWEFSLVTKSAEFAQGQYFLSCVMLSFRSNERGELRVLRLSDKF